MMTLIIHYGSGNLRSVWRAALAVSDKQHIIISDEAQKIVDADRIILPGVGAFEACYKQLVARPHLLQALNHAVIQQAKPFLGICVGMQMVAQHSLEYGKSPGLGWMCGESRPLPKDKGLPIPHMGWNQLAVQKKHPLFAPMENENLYFAHSFILDGVEQKYIAANCTYGEIFCAAIANDNIIGTQFHPEKSQKIGLGFLKRFLNWKI